MTMLLLLLAMTLFSLTPTAPSVLPFKIPRKNNVEGHLFIFILTRIRTPYSFSVLLTTCSLFPLLLNYLLAHIFFSQATYLLMKVV